MTVEHKHVIRFYERGAFFVSLENRNDGRWQAVAVDPKNEARSFGGTITSANRNTPRGALRAVLKSESLAYFLRKRA